MCRYNVLIMVECVDINVLNMVECCSKHDRMCRYNVLNMVECADIMF